MKKTVLILGASGRFGRHATEAFWNAGWAIRSFDRTKDDLMLAARDAEVIVAGWNPPYPDWATQLPALHTRIQDAARASGSTVIVPGNVYVFAPDTPAPWGPDSAHAATNPLGRLRIDMETSYRNSGVQTILLRAGDFIDTEASGNWLDRVMMAKLAKGCFTYPGRTDVSHTWAFLPDLARATVLLAEGRDRLDTFTDIAFPGTMLTGQQLCDAVAAATGRPLRLSRMSWLPLHLARPFWPMARHLVEMRYLWDTPHWLDGAQFSALCPNFHPTDIDEIMHIAVSTVLTPAQAIKNRPYSNTRSTQTIL